MNFSHFRAAVAIAAACAIALTSLAACSGKEGDGSDGKSTKATTSATAAATASSKPTTGVPITDKTAVPEDYTVVTSVSGGKVYFDDAVFLGDSRLDDFVMYMDLPKESDYADTGLNVSSVYTKKFIELNGETLTAMDAIKQNKSFNKVYLMFGINEIAWPHLNVFIKDYAKIIDDIREINPDAIIYVQSIPPVTAKLDSESDEYKNESIATLNAMIKDMAAEKNTVFLDVASALAAEDGALPSYAAADGIHMGKKLCTQWFNFLVANEVERIS